MKRSEKWIKYDFINGGKELLNRKFGWNLKIKFDDTRDICSDFVSQYQVNIGMVSNIFKKLKIAFPQDAIRYATSKTLIIN